MCRLYEHMGSDIVPHGGFVGLTLYPTPAAGCGGLILYPTPAAGCGGLTLYPTPVGV